MKSIQQLVTEHDNILRYTEILTEVCAALLENQELDIRDFKLLVDFGRNYADRLHHQKEEEILFDEMLESMGEIAAKLITHGMMVEHDLARLYLLQSEQAVQQFEQQQSTAVKLDIIGNAMAYRDLLRRHIEKENDAVFKYAQANLSEKSMQRIEAETEQYENTDAIKRDREKYLEILEQLTEKYL